MCRRLDLLSCFVLLLPVYLSLQAPVAHAQKMVHSRFGLLTTEQGLSHGMVVSILQDKKGFMWFGTNDGLNRYDGYQFIIYRHNNKDSFSLSDNIIYALFEDEQQRLWVGTDKGLDLFNRALHRFTHIEALSGRRINQITTDCHGGIWISSSKGLEHLTVQAGNKQGTGRKTEHMHIVHMAAADTIWQHPELTRGSISLLADSKGDCFAVNSEAVFKLLPGKVGVPPEAKRLYTFKRSDAYNAGNLLEDPVQHCYLLQTGTGLFIFPDATFRATPVQAPCNAWYPITKGPENLFYFQEGKTIFSWKPGMPAPDTLVPYDPDKQLAFENARCLYGDQNSNLWIGTNGYGILKRGKQPAFTHVLDNKYISDIRRGYHNDAYVNERYHLSFTNTGACTIDSLHTVGGGLETDSLHYLWNCTGSTLLRFDNRQKITVRYRVPGCKDNYLLRPLCQATNGALWLQHGDSLVHFDVQKGIFHTYPFALSFPEDYWDFMGTGLAEGPAVWLATRKGIFAFDTARHTWRRYPQQPGDTAMQQNQPILQLYADPLQPALYIWAGTKDGLLRLNKYTGAFTVYRSTELAGDNMINMALPDSEGHFWISTNKGLTRFTLATGAMQYYDRGDGLHNYEFNGGMGCTTTCGTMLFGGLEGIDYFRPEDVRPLPPPRVALTGLRLFNKPVGLNDSATPLKMDIAYATELWLNHHQSMLTLSFAGLDYSLDNAILYRYRLQGFDADWVYTGKSHEAIYTNLDPGTYTFCVQASYPAGDWGATTLLTLHVIPPWWRTVWFYLFVLLAVAGLVYSLYRYRIRQLTRLESMRKSIARDLHDDIGATLSATSIYATIAARQLPDQDTRSLELLKKISNNNDRVMDAISDMIWSINTGHADFSSMVSRMREHAAGLFEDQDCVLHFDASDTDIAAAKLPLEKWRDFYLIYKEALNNVAKYAHCKNVYVKFHLPNGKLQLSVMDDGIGFDIQNPKRRGNGIGNMHQRAAAIGASLKLMSTPEIGTQMYLQL